MQTTAPPNVLFILTDDQGYGDLSCHGSPVLQTPAMDRLHAESVRLTDFHVGPTCAPTRSTLLTGHYANSTGVWHTIGGRSLLRDDEWTFADALQADGYRTALFGKWHLGDNYPYRPMDRGFQTTVTHAGGGISQTPDHWGNDYFDDTYSYNGNPQPYDGYCTDVWFRLATDYIDTPDDRPFCCMIAPNAPHTPWNVEDRYVEPYRGRCPDDRARFFGLIANLDENLGRLLDHLEANGLADNTIVVFMTDNGTAGGVALDRNGFVTDGFNAGMRGVKGWAHEGGHRVPCFIRWPNGGLGGTPASAKDVDDLTASVDFMPTLLDLCGATVPDDRTFHGTSLVPLLRGEPQPKLDGRIVVTDSQRNVRPVKWKDSAAMRGKWRLINGEALYDTAADPEQRDDLANDHPQIVSDLRAGYETWWDLVTVRADERIPISVLPDRPTDLNAHDWRNDTSDAPWHQGMIRTGYVCRGHWELEVGVAGVYRIEMRRWPIEAGAALDADPPAVDWRRDAVHAEFADWYDGGRRTVFERAVIRIDDTRYEQPVASDAEAAVFEVLLDAGPLLLQADFEGDAEGTIGAYYVRVSPVV
ncbi:MAG: arylsulfatase [Planctomycetota bacterium]